MANHVFVLSLLAFACAVAYASDPSPLQDFCIADPTSPAGVNGQACLDSKLAQADHFFLSGLNIAGNTSNPLGSKVTPANVAQIPGLNTLGISLARLDYAPLYAGFVTSNPENRLISKVLQKGDVFIFPVGLVHFQQNVGYGNAISISALSSQNPGVITVASAVFGSKPPIEGDVLAKAFQVDKFVIDGLQAQF
ncbi:hypothetical protein SLA2020_269590 [Shorea laevis]